MWNEEKKTEETWETGSELKSTTKKEKKNYGFMRQTREEAKKTFQPGQPVSLSIWLPFSCDIDVAPEHSHVSLSLSCFSLRSMNGMRLGITQNLISPPSHADSRSTGHHKSFAHTHKTEAGIWRMMSCAFSYPLPLLQIGKKVSTLFNDFSDKEQPRKRKIGADPYSEK
jgi:hypothetical protein